MENNEVRTFSIETMTTIRHVGIIGEGKMGTNIFQYLTGFEYQLSWICSDQADTDKLQRTFQKRIKRSVDAGIITGEQYLFLREKSHISKDKELLANCDLIIETVPEDLELKKVLFAEIDRIVKPSCILASNSSSISPGLLVPSQARKDKTVGLHFFYPVSLKNIAEFVVLPETTEGTKAQIVVFFEKIERRYLVLPENGAFILNRIFLDVQNEAFRMVQEGKCSYRQMDKIVKEGLSPAGIFEFFDSVGNDVMLASILNYTRDHPHKERYADLINKLVDLVKAGKLGNKSGTGFYDQYPAAGDDHILFIDSDVSDAISHQLYNTLQSAVNTYSFLTGLPADAIRLAMNEYLGIEK